MIDRRCLGFVCAAAASLAALFQCGCASHALEMSVQTRAESYRMLEDPSAVLMSSPPACAVLPANAGTTPGFGAFLNTAMERVLRQIGASETVIPPTEVGNLMVERGKRADLNELLQSWQPSNVLDPATLNAVAGELGVEFLMVPYLVTYGTNNDARFSFFGITLVRTGWTTVQIVLQLWHAPSGMLVWQSQGISTLACEGVIGPPVATGETARHAVIHMLQDFLQGRSESVIVKKLPIPKRTSEDPLDPEPPAPHVARPREAAATVQPADPDTDDSNLNPTKASDGGTSGRPRLP